MGVVNIPVVTTPDTLSRAIVQDLCRSIIRQTGFPAHKTTIHISSGTSSRRTLKNVFDDCYNEKGIRTKYGNFIFAEYEDKFTDTSLMHAHMGQSYEKPIFVDEALGVALHPVYGESQLDFTLRFRANDRSRLNHWVNGIRMRHQLRELVTEHNIRYDYSIPMIAMDFLCHVWDLREAQAGYGDAFMDYIMAHMTEGFQHRSNLNGTHKEPIVNEMHMSKVAAVNDSAFYNEVEVDNGIFEVSMPVTLFYKRIVAVKVTYPATIHGQFIDRKWVDRFIPREALVKELGYDAPLRYSPQGYLKANKTGFFHLGDGGSRPVEWDDFFPIYPNPDTQTVSLLPIAVDEHDPTLMFNLTELDGDFIPDGVIPYLRKYWEEHNKMHKSIVQIELYSIDEKGERRQWVLIDENLNLRTQWPMNVRARQYVRITLLKDLAMATPIHTRDLLEDPDIFIPLLKLYDPDITVTDDIEMWKEIMPLTLKQGRVYRYPSLIVSTGGVITDHSYYWWLRKLKGINSWFRWLRPANVKRVGNYPLTAKKRS